MKLFGIGTDIVKISRIKKSINKKKFLSRLFNEKLLNVKTKNSSNCYAKRFAAKEAFPKHWEQGYQEELTSMRL